jgi:hypothetical protein
MNHTSASVLWAESLSGPAQQPLEWMGGATQQRDAADEGRLDAYGSIIGGRIIVNQGEVVRPSQLIASVRRARVRGRRAARWSTRR